MRFPARIPRAILFPIAGCLGIIVAPRSARAQCPDASTVTFDGVSDLEGKPFQAKRTTTFVTFLSDGTKRVQVYKDHIFRDSKGRVRDERYGDGSEFASEDVPVQIGIDDRCGTSIILLPAKHTAKIQQIALVTTEYSSPPCQPFDANHLPKTSPDGKVEYLGTKMIGEAEVLGMRWTYFRSVQALSSGAAPVDIHERWCWKGFDTLLDSYSLTPNRKETTIAYSDVIQIEPDPELFEIPKEYTIVKAEQSAKPSTKPNDPSKPSDPQ